MFGDEESIREQIGQVENELAGLATELEVVDRELDRHAARTRRYELLEKACASLDELAELGAAELFWGDAEGAERAADHVAMVRRRIAEFEEEIGEIRQRRQAVETRIERQQDALMLLEDDLDQLLEEQESSQYAWVVEREEDELPYRAQIMPWMRGVEEDWRFRRALASTLAIATVLAMLFPFIDLPLPERTKLTEVPERVAQLIREERQPPAPQPVVEPEPEPEPDEPEPEPEPQLAEETPPEPTPESVAEPAPEETRQANTREQVKSKGILAFRDSFANRAQSRPAAQLGSQARLGNAGESAVGRPTRAMVTTDGPGSSGGINLADISRDVGGGGSGEAIGGVQVSQVASSIGTAGTSDRPLAGGPGAGRTDEEIQIVFDRYKAALYRLYNRELRKDPTLRGQLVLRLTIEPDGSVSLCQLQSSDMDAPVLAEQVVERVRGFDFGAKDVVAMTIVYPIDFLPAA